MQLARLLSKGQFLRGASAENGSQERSGEFTIQARMLEAVLGGAYLFGADHVNHKDMSLPEYDV